MLVERGLVAKAGAEYTIRQRMAAPELTTFDGTVGNYEVVVEIRKDV